MAIDMLAVTLGLGFTWFFAWLYSKGTNKILSDTGKILERMDARTAAGIEKSDAAHLEIMAMIQKGSKH